MEGSLLRDLFLLGYPSPGSASHGKQGSEEAEEAWRASGVTSRSNKSQFGRVPLRRESSEPFALDIDMHRCLGTGDAELPGNSTFSRKWGR